MNTSKRVVFDVSPFLLLEASADSEAGHSDVEDEEIDHESSCSETSTSRVTWAIHRPVRLATFEVEDTDTVEEEEGDKGEEEEEEEGEVNSYIRCGRSSQCQNHHLPLSSPANLTEMDQSRMFWEACLAS